MHVKISRRAKPIGYFMNILSHLPITKVQIRLIAKAIEKIEGYDAFAQEQIFLNTVKKYSGLSEQTLRAM